MFKKLFIIYGFISMLSFANSLPKSEYKLIAKNNTISKNRISEKEAVDMVFKSIKRHKLANANCISVSVGEYEDSYFIDVRSNNEKCGGDPGVSSILFSYEVNKTTGKLGTDCYDWAKKRNYEWSPGEYNPID